MAVVRLRQAALLAALCSALVPVGPSPAQVTLQPERRAETPEPPARPDIVVRGRPYEELRLQIRLAEEAVFARFNEINSTDDFDIHCREETRGSGRIVKRTCLSNSWREQDANFAEAILRPGTPPQYFIAQQQLMQARLREEARRLALEDEELGEAVLNLGRAKLALARRAGQEDRLTAWRQVSAGATGLPYDAARVFEVRVGKETWEHLLEERTFTFASVTGNIRSLKVDCCEHDEDFDYEPDAEWTLPTDWSSCILIVRAQKDTTFALLEF